MAAYQNRGGGERAATTTVRRSVRAQPAPEDLGSGLWSVPVPIPGNPLGYTLVYAIDTRNGPVLIDAGWEHEKSWEALSGGLTAFGLDVTDVYGVIVTHHHPDHSGLAGRVREASGAWIAMHAADVEMIRKFHQFRRDGDREWEFITLRRAGASEAEIACCTISEPAFPRPERTLTRTLPGALPARHTRPHPASNGSAVAPLLPGSNATAL